MNINTLFDDLYQYKFYSSHDVYAESILLLLFSLLCILFVLISQLITIRMDEYNHKFTFVFLLGFLSFMSSSIFNMQMGPIFLVVYCNTSY